MNCLKICGFVFALIAALTTAEAATQVLNAGGHTLIQTDRTQYIRKN
ncbi:immune-induced peptide 14 [Drosophila miranda]|uniref:Immune-induced peptide 14 n=1 Tax=Drosophila pseudoobscura pseudoobscura TaxID=46245 RepID=A0A6I8VF10_DROPS|nr:immune-induced peptide 14 [Drosophila pseudoobscura]XP_017145995.1 immune-induced peptide 14 [Drosophila miranda]XP_026841597.1 immune-induced peptide 14 [Drosophila persimilis]